MLRRAYVVILLLYAVHFYYVHIAYTGYPESLITQVPQSYSIFARLHVDSLIY